MNFKNYNPEKYGIKKFQEGGEMAPADQAAPEQAAPEQGGGEDPMQQLLMACQQALQSQDCNLAMQVCQALMQMAGSGGAPEQAPAEPVYRRGGRLVRRIQK